MKIRATPKLEKSLFKKGAYACVLCGSTNRIKCGETVDGGLRYCSELFSEKRDKLGRYLHSVSTKVDAPLASKMSRTEQIENVEPADANTLNKAYVVLLEDLTLEERHSENLLVRGLGDDAIARNLYASVPSFTKRKSIAKELSETVSLRGVPGFYKEDDEWVLHMTLPGFYIPYRNCEGLITGLQIRLDEPKDNRYVWLSSDGKDNGVSSGSPLHYVNLDIAKQTEQIYITEGALKADVLSNRMNVGVIATAGVNAISPEKLLKLISQSCPKVKNIVIAYDMDWETNPNVAEALERLLEAFESFEECSVRVASWDVSRGKGIDDLTANDDFVKDEIELTHLPEFLEQHLYPTIKALKNTNVIETESSNKELCMPTTEGEFRFGQSWAEFAKQQFDSSERTIFGLERGELGLLVASTNIGKSTLALNMMISAASSIAFKPLFDNGFAGRRMMYIDGEASKSGLQSDLAKMLNRLSDTDRAQVGSNLYIVCDATASDGNSLNLANEEHFNQILNEAILFKPDVIVIDTLSALFEIEDENDNALVMKGVIQPLRKLARHANASILLLHHTGKNREGYSAEKAYRGRGASAFGGAARAVFTLEKNKLLSNQVRLSCAKVKGEVFETTLFELDRSTRWFKPVEVEVEVKETEVEIDTKYAKMVDFVIEYKKPVSRKLLTILLAKNGIEIPYSTLGKYIKTAKRLKHLGGKYGQVAPPEVEIVESNTTLELNE